MGRILEIQNRGEDFPGARSNETRGRQYETRDPIRAPRLGLGGGTVVGSAAPRGGAPSRPENFAAGSRSGNGSHRALGKWFCSVTELLILTSETALHLTLLSSKTSFPRN